MDIFPTPQQQQTQQSLYTAPINQPTPLAQLSQLLQGLGHGQQGQQGAQQAGLQGGVGPQAAGGPAFPNAIPSALSSIGGYLGGLMGGSGASGGMNSLEQGLGFAAAPEGAMGPFTASSSIPSALSSIFGL